MCDKIFLPNKMNNDIAKSTSFLALLFKFFPLRVSSKLGLCGLRRSNHHHAPKIVVFLEN